MGDVMPNVSLDKMRLEIERDSLVLNNKKADLRIAQLYDERDRVQANKEATDKSIQEIDKKLGVKNG
jgi:hypothetical protein